MLGAKSRERSRYVGELPTASTKHKFDRSEKVLVDRIRAEGLIDEWILEADRHYIEICVLREEAKRLAWDMMREHSQRIADDKG